MGYSPDPTFHKPIPTGQVVIIDDNYHDSLKGFSGEVVGVASAGVIFHYIVLLDEPMETQKFDRVKAITVPGTHLTGFTGESFKKEV